MTFQKCYVISVRSPNVFYLDLFNDDIIEDSIGKYDYVDENSSDIKTGHIWKCWVDGVQITSLNDEIFEMYEELLINLQQIIINSDQFAEYEIVKIENRRCFIQLKVKDITISDLLMTSGLYRTK